MAGFHHKDFRVIESTPWGVPVIDVQPLTQNVVSTSQDPSCAQNALSYTGEDGAELAAQTPPFSRIVQTFLRIPIDGVLADGIVCRPGAMEDKWAVYLHAGRLLFVRSWRRQVVADAGVNVADGVAVIGPVRGTFTDDDEQPEFTGRLLEYIVRDIALGEGLPTPLPAPFADYFAAATYCFSLVGSRARFATHLRPNLSAPARPLCAHTLIHIAAARGQAERIPGLVARGIPIAARGPDGLAAIHWSVGGDGIEVAAALLEAGTPVDLPSREGATPLIQAVQANSVDHVRLFLAQGADPNAADCRGFTSLHRAAEMGLSPIVQILLDSGAAPGAAAQGHTPLSLAKSRQQKAIVQMLERATRSR